MRSNWRVWAVLVLFAGLVPLLPVSVAVADNAVVAAPCGEDDFDAALATALTNGGGTITFACGGLTTITFTGEKTIPTGNSVVIDGANEITFDGGNSTRLFFVQFNASLEIRGATLTNGFASPGGAIYNQIGVVSVVDSVFTGNVAMGNYGGAIYSIGDELTLARTTFENNHASWEGGAVAADGGSITVTASAFIGNHTGDGVGGDTARAGALHIGGTGTVDKSVFSGNWADDYGGAFVDSTVRGVTITSSTFSGNYTLEGEGGAIYTLGAMTIADSTITLNDAGDDQGDGIHNEDLTGAPALSNTIVAGNLGTDCSGPIDSLGFNLDSDGSCSLDAGGDIPNGNAGLGPLADHGGLTMTHLPFASGDAYDNGGGCLQTDQRSEPRPSGNACDIGAVEIQQTTFTLCANYYTGQVTSPFSGQCGAYQAELETPDDLPLSFCLHPWTGAVSYTFGRPCTTPRFAHVVPDDGDLLLCTNFFTGGNRWVYNHSQCTVSEFPSVIPVP